VTISFELFELTKNLYLLSFSQGQGSLKSYLSIYSKIYQLIKSLAMVEK